VNVQGGVDQCLLRVSIVHRLDVCLMTCRAAGNS